MMITVFKHLSIIQKRRVVFHGIALINLMMVVPIVSWYYDIYFGFDDYLDPYFFLPNGLDDIYYDLWDYFPLYLWIFAPAWYLLCDILYLDYFGPVGHAAALMVNAYTWSLMVMFLLYLLLRKKREMWSEFVFKKYD